MTSPGRSSTASVELLREAEGLTEVYRLEDGRAKSGLYERLEEICHGVETIDDLRRSEEIARVARLVLEWTSRAGPGSQHEARRAVEVDLPEATSAIGIIEELETPHDQEAGMLADRDRLRTGAALFELPDRTPAVWGKGNKVLWAQGEGLMIAAPQGVGKTTIAQQLVLHGLGVRSGELFDLPVRPIRRALYRLFGFQG
jgi:hypothetical protein